jgi:protein-S-isoprenylcysteine O-methyltransferase Ste14
VFLRALLAFLACPGLMAFVLPAFVAGVEQGAPARWSVAGIVAFGAGVAGLLACVREFYVAGKGTLAPWSPPERLVTTGLYAWSRNPMYLSVLLILAGWALLYRRDALWAYAALMAVVFHLRVLLGEEPWQARTFGAAWTDYAARVPRWLGRPRRARGENARPPETGETT